MSLEDFHVVIIFLEGMGALEQPVFDIFLPYLSLFTSGPN
jgi:hypothetical protein